MGPLSFFRDKQSNFPAAAFEAFPSSVASTMSAHFPMPPQAMIGIATEFATRFDQIDVTSGHDSSRSMVLIIISPAPIFSICTTDLTGSRLAPFSPSWCKLRSCQISFWGVDRDENREAAKTSADSRTNFLPTAIANRQPRIV